MLTHSNIDRRDSAVVSKAPFTYDSTLVLDTQDVPSGCVLSVKVYVEEAYRVPYRIHSIEQDGKVWFCDSAGKKAVYWQVFGSTEVEAVKVVDMHGNDIMRRDLLPPLGPCDVMTR